MKTDNELIAQKPMTELTLYKFINEYASRQEEAIDKLESILNKIKPSK